MLTAFEHPSSRLIYFVVVVFLAMCFLFHKLNHCVRMTYSILLFKSLERFQNTWQLIYILLNSKHLRGAILI